MILPLLVLAVGAVLAGKLFYGGFVGSAYEHHASAASHVEKVMPAAGPDSQSHTKDQSYDGEESHGEKHNDDTHDVAEVTHGESEAHSINVWSREYFWHDSLFVLPENDTVEAAHGAPFWVKKLPLLMGILGIALAYLIYMLKPGTSSLITRAFKPLHTLFFNKWYFDELYTGLFVRNALRLGRIFWRGDKQIVDGIGPDGVSGLSQRIGNNLSKFQSGYVYQYALVMIVALICIVSWFVFKADPSFYSIETSNTLMQEGPR